MANVTDCDERSAMNSVETPKQIVEERGKVTRQFLAGILGNLAGVVTGCIIGWTSPSLPKLKDETNPPLGRPITSEEDSWISSLASLAAAVGPFFAGFLAEKIGRKRALLSSSVPILISWICLAVADAVWVLYLGRTLAGLALGWIFTVLPMYCGEVASTEYRGALGSLMQLSIVIGLLFDYCIGPYVPYMWLSLGAMIFPVTFVLSFLFMPETPAFLLKIGEDSAAKKSLMWLRGKSAEGVATELKILKHEVDEASQQKGSLKDLFGTKATRKAIFLCFGLVGFQQLAGINVVLFNAQPIFSNAGGSVSSDLATIITGVVMMVASFVTPLVVEKLGRRLLLLISSVGMALAQFLLGLCFYLPTVNVDTEKFSFLPVVSVVVFISVYSIGFGPLPWAVMGEMFPTNVKALASTLTASFCWILSFLVTRFFNDLRMAIGDGWTFWIFAISCCVATVFVFFLLPETKGKTLKEIQAILEK